MSKFEHWDNSQGVEPHWFTQWRLTCIANRARDALNMDGIINPSVDLARCLSQIINIATNGNEGDAHE